MEDSYFNSYFNIFSKKVNHKLTFSNNSNILNDSLFLIKNFLLTFDLTKLVFKITPCGCFYESGDKIYDKVKIYSYMINSDCCRDGKRARQRRARAGLKF